MVFSPRAATSNSNIWEFNAPLADLALGVYSLLNEEIPLSNDLQFFILVPATGVVGFVLCVLWGCISRSTSFDRDTAIFLAKIWFGIVTAGIILGLLMKY